MIRKTTKQDILSKISSIQTLVNKYPVLLGNYLEDVTSFSFLFNILKKIGVTEDQLTEWASKMLSDGGKKGTDGILSVIEYGIRSVILADLNKIYSCQINPKIPKGITYNYNPTSRVRITNGSGISINVNDLDVFGILNYCPTNKNESIYYFDSSPDNEYTPSNVYTSTDLNAFLWYIINSGGNINNNNNVWDNRYHYRKKFLNSKNVISGNLSGSDPGVVFKRNFFNAEPTSSPYKVIDAGNWPATIKEQLFACQFDETVGNNGGVLRVFLNGDRYNGKTIIDFNTDYMLNMKLFDSKTILTNVLNAIAGVFSSTKLKINLNGTIISECIEDIIKQSLNEIDEEKKIDCYFSFSDKKYDELYQKALKKYSNNYSKPQNTKESGKTEEITELLNLIDNAGTEEEETAIIKRTICSAVGTPSSSNSNLSLSIVGYDTIEELIHEITVQCILNAVSPKIMLIYAINEALYEEDTSKPFSLENAMNNFLNTLSNIAYQIAEIFMNAIGDIIISYVSELLKLWAEKLLKESLDYYIKLLTDLRLSLTESYRGALSTLDLLKSNFSRAFSDVRIDSVYGADISAKNNSPEKC